MRAHSARRAPQGARGEAPARVHPFLPAMSLLHAADKEPRSYLEISDALRQYGAMPGKDYPQLWQRIVFSILVSNTDDHLRNHGFLYDPAGGRRLSRPPMTCILFRRTSSRAF